MKRIRRWFHYAIGAAAGAAAAYLFDPDRGRARRAQLKDQAQSRLRKAERDVEGKARHAAGQAQGRVATATGHGEADPTDDHQIADLVRQSLAGLTFSTPTITVEVVDGWATLRGQVASPNQLQQVVDVVRATPGVADVGSYLHLPGEPAPNKEQALRAS